MKQNPVIGEKALATTVGMRFYESQRLRAIEAFAWRSILSGCVRGVKLMGRPAPTG